MRPPSSPHHPRSSSRSSTFRVGSSDKKRRRDDESLQPKPRGVSECPSSREQQPLAQTADWVDANIEASPATAAGRASFGSLGPPNTHTHHTPGKPHIISTQRIARRLRGGRAASSCGGRASSLLAAKHACPAPSRRLLAPCFGCAPDTRHGAQRVRSGGAAEWECRLESGVFDAGVRSAAAGGTMDDLGRPPLGRTGEDWVASATASASLFHVHSWPY